MSIQVAKTVIVGETQVGKTSLAKKAFLENYDPNSIQEPTIGAEFWERVFKSDDYGNSVKLEVWDTAGQEAYKSLAPVFFQNSSIAILVFDVTEKKSIESLDYYVEILHECVPNCFIAVVGNKIDLSDKRKISPKEGQSYAKSIGTDFYMETSALTGEGVEDLFSSVARQKNLSFSYLPKPINYEQHDDKGKCC